MKVKAALLDVVKVEVSSLYVDKFLNLIPLPRKEIKLN